MKIRRRGKFLCLIFIVSICFLQVAFAAPGDENDPLVTKSWVDNSVKTAFGKLEKQLEEIKKVLVNGKIVMYIGKSTVSVNDVNKTIDAAPFLFNTTTMVPVRFIGESMGAKVQWDGANKKVVYTKGEKKVVLKVNSKISTVNGTEKALTQAPILQKERVFVPVRFVGEALGAKVQWDGPGKKITIKY